MSDRFLTGLPILFLVKMPETVNLDYVLKTIKGVPMQQTKADEMGQPIPDGKDEQGRPKFEMEPVTLRDALVNIILGQYKDDKVDGRQARKRNRLAENIETWTDPEFELTVVQVSLIGKLVEKTDYTTRAKALICREIGYQEPEDDE